MTWTKPLSPEGQRIESLQPGKTCVNVKHPRSVILRVRGRHPDRAFVYENIDGHYVIRRTA